jgi:hypothetical protein
MISYSSDKNIKHHLSKFSRHGDLAPRIWACVAYKTEGLKKRFCSKPEENFKMRLKNRVGILK